MENLTFVLEFIALVAVLVIVAVIAEKLIAKKNNTEGKILTTRKTAMIGMFSAIAGVLMTIPVTVGAPGAGTVMGVDAPGSWVSVPFTRT